MRKPCKEPGCNRKHHAQGYCNTHYQKFRKYGEPTAGKFVKSGPRPRRNHATAILMDTYQMEPEKRKKRTQDHNNFAFFINQPIIENLFNEAVKAVSEPKFIAANGDMLPDILGMAASYAGCAGNSRLFLNELISDLTEHVNNRDLERFLADLVNWDKLLEEYNKRPRRAQQLSFFNNEAATPRKNSKTV